MIQFDSLSLAMGDPEIPESFNTDVLLEQLGGCGRFQVYLSLIFNTTAIPTLFLYLFMSFGMYNPGWRCLDNVIYTSTNGDTVSDDVNMTRLKETNQTLPKYQRDTCHGFDTCQHVEFNPEASTIVTEWGLACNRAWILSTILSVQMAGGVGSLLLSGYIGDRYGRKLPYFISMLCQVVLNLISIFSVSWQMYAVVSFIMGFTSSFEILAQVLNTEYVNSTWRLRIKSVPTWTIISIIFATSAMLSKSWQILRLVVVVSGAITLIPLMWIPESMRWLSVRGKEEKVRKVVKKVARTNNVEIPQEDHIRSLIQKNMEGQKGAKSYTTLHLFRVGYRRTSIIIGLLIFLSDIIWYVISFGVSALPGNIYTNLMIFAVADLPANFISYFVANRYARKPTILSCYILESVCLFGVVAVDRLATGQVKEIGILVLVMVTKVSQYMTWIVMSTFVLELYPTIVRSTVISYVWFASVLGGVIAPYMIPTNPDLFYIFFLVMAVMLIVCAALILLVPETKGKPLKDRW